MTVSRWKRFRFRLEWLLCAVVAFVIPRLPRRLCVALANAAGALAYRFDRRGRMVAHANLQCAFGGRYSEPERARIARRSYQNFARTMLDLFWAQRLTPANWEKYIEVKGDVAEFLSNSGAHGSQELQKPVPRSEGETGGTRGRHGAILMCVHWGNFEWASLAVGFLGVKTMIVAENFKNPRLSTFFNGAREVSGHRIIPQENSMLRLLKVVKRKGAAGMLIDLTLRPDQAAVAIDAFGHKMSVTFLHGVLAGRGGALLVPFHGESLPDGRCRVEMDSPLSFPAGASPSPQEIAQLCWNHFEPRIRERPELWMWAYKHWRYRPRDARPEDYPFYANVSSKFEKLLADRPLAVKKRPPRTISAVSEEPENGAVN